LTGQGEADANRARGLVEAEVLKAKGLADADVIRARGLTEADVIKAQGLSEAEAMRRKAEAWEQYTQAAVLQFLIQNLPALAEAIAKPLAQTDKIVVVNTGGQDGGTGVAKITHDVTNILAQMPEVVDALTGVNLVDLIKSLPAIKKAAQEKETSQVAHAEEAALPTQEAITAPVEKPPRKAKSKAD
jgi:flotillin